MPAETPEAQPVVMVVAAAGGLRRLTQPLEERGLALKVCDSLRTAQESLRSTSPDLLILVTPLPDGDTGALCRSICAGGPGAPRLVVVGPASEAHLTAAFAAGAVDYITEPVRPAELCARVGAHLTQCARQRTLALQVTESMVALQATSLRLQAEIVERRLAEADLERHQQLLQCLLDANIIGIMFWRLDGKIFDANQSFIEMFNLPAADVHAGLINWMDLIAPSEHERTARVQEALVVGGRQPPYEKQCRRPDGSLFPVLVGSARPPGSSDFGISFVLDLSEHKLMEQEILRSHKKLRTLGARMESRVEEQRKAIARELHDEQGSVLTALKMDLSMLRRMLPDASAKVREQLDTMQALIESAVRVMRQVATELRPAVLNLGLIPAIEWLIDDFRRRNTIHCQFVRPDDALTLDDHTATVLFRVVQESFTNIARHAQARHVDIQLEKTPAHIRLSIADDGVGFNAAHIAPQSFGLLGMRERVSALGGEFVIDAAVGQGTTLLITLPIKEPA